MTSAKPCGHPPHPEDGNVGIAKDASGVRAERAADVAAHRGDPSWFVKKFVKAGFPESEGATRREWMWVAVTGVLGKKLVGSLENTPVRAVHLQHGQQVEVAMEDVLDVLESEDA